MSSKSTRNKSSSDEKQPSSHEDSNKNTNNTPASVPQPNPASEWSDQSLLSSRPTRPWHTSDLGSQSAGIPNMIGDRHVQLKISSTAVIESAARGGYIVPSIHVPRAPTDVSTQPASGQVFSWGSSSKGHNRQSSMGSSTGQSARRSSGSGDRLLSMEWLQGSTTVSTVSTSPPAPAERVLSREIVFGPCSKCGKPISSADGKTHHVCGFSVGHRRH